MIHFRDVAHLGFLTVTGYGAWFFGSCDGRRGGKARTKKKNQAINGAGPFFLAKERMLSGRNPDSAIAG
jgi:hypothetical protein